MPTCPQGPQDDPDNKYHYKIYIQYNIRKYMPSDIYHNFTGDEVPTWSPDKNARNSMFSVYKSKKEKENNWFRKGDTVIYYDKEHPNHEKKAKITNVLKPQKVSKAYEESLKNKTTYVKPPEFPPEYTLTFENPTVLPSGQSFKTLKIKGENVKKLKKEGNSITHICLPVKGKSMTKSVFQPHAARIIKKGFIKKQEFLPLAISARFTKQEKLNSWDLVPPDKTQKFKIRKAELVDFAALEDGKRRKITIRVKLTLDIEGGDGASLMDNMGYKFQNFTDAFDCEENREKLQENIQKIGQRGSGKRRTRKKRGGGKTPPRSKTTAKKVRTMPSPIRRRLEAFEQIAANIAKRTESMRESTKKEAQEIKSKTHSRGGRKRRRNTGRRRTRKRRGGEDYTWSCPFQGCGADGKITYKKYDKVQIERAIKFFREHMKTKHGFNNERLEKIFSDAKDIEEAAEILSTFKKIENIKKIQTIFGHKGGKRRRRTRKKRKKKKRKTKSRKYRK